MRLQFHEPSVRVDPLQLVALAGLMFIGTAFVYSATMANASAALLPWYDQSWVRQILWYALGLGAGGALCLVDYLSLSRWSYVAYWLTILTLVAVLIPKIGSTHGWGARRWIDLGFFQFQPSEFAKLAFILAAANFLSRPLEGHGPVVFAVRPDLEGAGFGVRPGAAAHGLGDDVRRGHAPDLFDPPGRDRRPAGRFICDGCLFSAHGLVADSDAAVSARPARDLFWL
jgi:hypothetical protein